MKSLKISDHEPLSRRLFGAARPGAAGDDPMQRRVFLKLSGMGGLALGFAACGADSGDPAGQVGPGDDGAQMTEQAQDVPPPVSYADVNAYVRIGSDDSVTLYCLKSDMGQGVMTSLSMLLAEELDVDWSKVRSEHPVASVEKYTAGMAYNQFTVGSTSIAQTYLPMRQMGAAARQMLIAAAAQRWSVPASDCTTSAGVVMHAASGQALRYAEVADLAATLPAPQDPPLKNEADFSLIGTPRSQLNARAKASGTAQYTLDVQLDGMLVGLVARSPALGGTLSAFDATAALAVPGVRQVVEIPAGVAVLADHFWAASKGREALTVEWAPGPNAALSTASLADSMRALMGQGDDRLMQSPEQAAQAEQAFVDAPVEQTLDVEYELPYLAHAPMEPLNAVAHVRGDSVEIWAGTQGPNALAGNVAGELGIAPEQVTIHVPLLGGAFGRRATNDFVLDAVHASRAAGNVPVKIVHTREDDMRSGFYRPMNCNRLRGAVDADGWPAAWVHNVVVQPIFGGFFATEGASTNYPYAVPNRRVTWADPQVQVPVFTWRSVGASQNGFIVESFIDELAALGNKDPLALRLRLLDDSDYPDAARHRAALENVAQRAGWDTPPAAGRARGIAVHQTFGTIVAEVAEISIDAGAVRVHKVWAAVDCGRAINPRGVEAQCEGAIIYGITAALYGRIDLEDGRPVQGNFDTYRLLRMSETPEIEVEIIGSGDPITGMGEPGVPPIAPAICNALFQLTGQRVRRLPIVLEA